ncbi:MAG: acetate--CoA ligase [Deltaproteobacteria bacterium]|nr:acetate--CoA ligase [Deltaproteobacteria bacterium]
MAEEVTLEGKVFEVPAAIRESAHIKGYEEYKKMYDRSISDPEGFWAEMAEQFVTWDKKWDKVWDWEFKTPKIKWFEGGKLNVTANCLDRHMGTPIENKVALIWEGNEPNETRKITYKQLLTEVKKFANVLKSKGIKKGDRVAIYLPMIPELPVSLLACARIGAIHSVVFGGFSPDALRDRIEDSRCKMVITVDGNHRGKKSVPLKINADKAVDGLSYVENMVVVKRSGIDVEMKEGRDFWYHDLMETASDECGYEVMDAEDPLFILYTSGSTGKPKGVVHTTGGYLTYVAVTHKYVFDYHDEDVFWCTADIGWVTGHSYIVYGPLANGATSVMFEGIPSYPDMGRFWEIVAKHKVNIFYTAPTAIRAIAKEGDSWVKKHDLSSLRILGTVGEPINPEAWLWYYNTVGGGRCPIVDTWWQTETGGILITPLPGAINIKPGSATLPFFGVEPTLVDDQGKELEGPAQGNLCIKRPWPGMMRTLYGDHDRFRQTYFSMYEDKYFTGDGARRDEDGYYWITGRVDDVINVSGHRMGTAEVESALVSHDAVAEAAVVGYPHEIKGQGIYAYVTLNTGVEKSDELRKELVKHVRKEIGPIATPDVIQWADSLPKTRSGKIMRRILRKVAANEYKALGDISTLADSSVVQTLIDDHKKLV